MDWYLVCALKSPMLVFIFGLVPRIALKSPMLNCMPHLFMVYNMNSRLPSCSCRYRHLVRLQIWFFKGGRGNVSLFLTYIMWYIKIYVFDGADYENNIKNFQYWFLGGLGLYYITFIIYNMWYIKMHSFDAVDYENDIKNFQFWFLRGVGWYFICFIHISCDIPKYMFLMV